MIMRLGRFAALAAFVASLITTAHAQIAMTQTAFGASNLVLRAAAGNLADAYVTTGSTAGFLMVFDATSLPPNGTITTPLKQCVQAPANLTTSISFLPGPPEFYASGIVLVFSTTGCVTLTASTSDLMLHGRTE